MQKSVYMVLDVNMSLPVAHVVFQAVNGVILFQVSVLPKVFLSVNWDPPTLEVISGAIRVDSLFFHVA